MPFYGFFEVHEFFQFFVEVGGGYDEEPSLAVGVFVEEFWSVFGFFVDLFDGSA